jgi:hypothetical protein
MSNDFRIKVTEMKKLPSERPDARARVYVFLDGESILDNFAKRAGLLERDEKMERELKRRAARVVASHFNVPDHMSYSRTAGCRCGCSPGFILKEHRGFDLFCNVRPLEA